MKLFLEILQVSSLTVKGNTDKSDNFDHFINLINLYGKICIIQGSKILLFDLSA